MHVRTCNGHCIIDCDLIVCTLDLGGTCTRLDVILRALQKGSVSRKGARMCAPLVRFFKQFHCARLVLYNTQSRT